MHEWLFERLGKSKFRSKFKLREKELEYINIKGMETVERHAEELIVKKLADPATFNDGKQTPMRGHPVFIAQHATATCCRECMYKWHKIEPSHVLTAGEREYIKSVIMEWIKRNCNDFVP